jgi:hypothetical protein
MPIALRETRTVPAEYHEAFWVVVGTAAPVLLLTAVVAIGQALETLPERALRRRRAAMQAGRRWRWPPKRWRHSVWIYVLWDPLYWVSFVALTINVLVFGAALTSLSVESDSWNLTLTRDAIAASILVILLLTGASANQRALQKLRAARQRHEAAVRALHQRRPRPPRVARALRPVTRSRRMRL